MSTESLWLDRSILQRVDLPAAPYEFKGLQTINVLLGKNGCGKSTALKAADSAAPAAGTANVRYITPERGGQLGYDPNTERNMLDIPTWLAESRRKNQFEQFRQQSFIQLRRLELAVLRDREAEGVPGDFQTYIDRLNGLLDNIELRREQDTFPVHSKTTGEQIQSSEISSGEAELISLGIEILTFARNPTQGAFNLLLLDEPDVHLHPDLQERLVRFLRETVEQHDITVVMATHSTAILGGLADFDEAAVCFMKAGQQELAFEAISDVHRRILPVFGAHPLSNVFNSAPALLVEGEDDERIWQQAIRSANGRLRLYPVHCGSVDVMHAYEVEVARIIEAVYDDGRAFSLRDSDGISDPIDPEGPVIRLRLACRAAENLLLTDDVLALAHTEWTTVRERMEQWLESGFAHPRRPEVQAFANGGFDRAQHDLKEIRMLLAGEMIATSKPWEVLVGQAIAQLAGGGGTGEVAEHSLASYLGPATVSALLS